MIAATLPLTLLFDADDRRLRAEIQAWLEQHDVTVALDDFDARIHALSEWQRQLHAAGFVGLSWPEEYGGKGLGLTAEAVLAEELARSATPELVNRLALFTIGPTLMDFGTEEQKRLLLPGMLDASEIWCQGFSEPGAGSDLAAVATTGRVDGDVVVVNGQKVWTSRALWSTWGVVLVRTEPGSRRHGGLSMLVVDMGSPGVTIQPLYQILHEPHFSEVFFDDVHVPLTNVVGNLGHGWDVAMAMLNYERGLFVLERQIRLGKRLDDLVDHLSEVDDARVYARELGELAATLEVLRAQVYRTLAAQDAGTLRPGETSVDKLLLTEADQALFGTAFDLMGPEVALGGDWIHDLLESRSVSIYSGTSEIQHNIIASKLLELPKG